MASKYQVGFPEELADDDPWFESESEAIEAAAKLEHEEQSRCANFWGQAVAVWDEQSNIVHLFAFGQQFRSV